MAKTKKTEPVEAPIEDVKTPVEETPPVEVKKETKKADADFGELSKTEAQFLTKFLQGKSINSVAQVGFGKSGFQNLISESTKGIKQWTIFIQPSESNWEEKLNSKSGIFTKKLLNWRGLNEEYIRGEFPNAIDLAIINLEDSDESQYHSIEKLSYSTTNGNWIIVKGLGTAGADIAFDRFQMNWGPIIKTEKFESLGLIQINRPGKISR